jgi:O-acetyl-ADP-ribose deacetylase (regulator of RNase III)
MAQAVMEETGVGRAVIRLVKGDITEQDVEAFVFYARPDLTLGSGVGTAISVRGGPTIQKELADLGPIAVGHAVVTGAGNLRAQWIIHAVGPRFQADLDRRGARVRARYSAVHVLRDPPGCGAGRRRSAS